ncbi:anti-anti-sigma factor [Ectothiorhodospira shaposhnikovii]|uniref:STAS domain-containing protein n=1 Tax=Ectothiorhodospira shaposhnikovii TaxID=1054 RepID=UPI001902F769|nr:STAS domain-containing protein [Ectothiorhodospira shaposhnikovii]MBK1673881.1 anti-anti-sigma factor [Ectothiorhodospira shaposhnikovii]
MTVSLPQFLQAHRDEMLAEWLAEWSSSSAVGLAATSSTAQTRHVMQTLFDEILSQLMVAPQDPPPGLDEHAPLCKHLRHLAAEQARHPEVATDPMRMMFSLRHLLLRHVSTWIREAGTTPVAEHLVQVNRYFDQIALFVFNNIINLRDRHISEQSLSLMELSTPVLRLWHRILLLPLVGIIDTGRARQVTDHLLEAIARHEARVTVIDLTGVPIIDTSVAQHIMKTIDAARLLGSRVVLTGISPEGAQTLTKLGIRFGDVICRATLRAGIAEALLIIGKRITAMEDQAR